MRPKISIIVPVYNAENYLHRCIDSILTQAFTDFELILVNDGSPDSSGAICNKYAEKDSRIKVIHKENGGVSSARNIGIEQAVGEWIWFVDADDYVENDSMNKINNSILNQQGNELCFSFGLNRIIGGKKYIKYNKPEDIKSSDYINRILSYSVTTGPCVYIYRRELIKKIKFNTTLEIGEDLCFNLEAMMVYQDKYVIQKEDNIYNYVINPMSVMAVKNLSFIKNYNCLSRFIYENIYCKTTNEDLRFYALVNIYRNFTAIFERLYENVQKKTLYIEQSTKIRTELFRYPILNNVICHLPPYYSKILKKALVSDEALWRYLFLLKHKKNIINKIKKLISQFKR